MAITERGTKSAGGHVTGVPDTEFVLLTRDGSPDVLETLSVSGTNPVLVDSYSFSGTGDVLDPLIYGNKVFVFDNNGASSRVRSFTIDKTTGSVTPSGSLLVADNPTAYGNLTDGAYCYMCTSNTYSGPRQLHCINTSDLSNIYLQGSSAANNALSGPTRVRFHPNNPDYIIVMKNNTGVVVNVSNRSSPTIDYSWSSTLFTQWGYQDFDVQYYSALGKSYLFTSYNLDGGYPGGIEVFDITDPDTSTWSAVTSAYDELYASQQRMQIEGNYLYSSFRHFASGQYGIAAMDIANPESISYIDRLVGANTNDITFVQKAGGDPIVVMSWADNGTTYSYDVPVSSYAFSGTLSDDAKISLLNTVNYQLFRQKSFSAGSYSFVAVSDQKSYHVIAERDSDGAMLVYADVTPAAYSG